MQKKYLILFVIIFCLIACKKNNHTKNIKVDIQKMDISAITEFDMKEVATFQSTIPLETTDECLIGRIEKVFIVDSCFVIWDKQLNRLLVFNLKGKYLYDIGKRGQAFDEFVRISYVYVDKDHKIIQIVDNATLKIVTYDLLGKFIESKSIKYHLYSYYPTEKGYWGTNVYQNPLKCDLIYIDNKKNDITKGYFCPNSPLIFLPTNNFTVNELNNQLLYHYRYSDTIYTIDNLTVKPMLVIDFGQNKNGLDINSTSFFEKFNSLEYVGQIHNLYAYGEHLFFSFYYVHGFNKPLDLYNAYISVNQQKSVVYQHAVHYTDLNISPLPEIIGCSYGNLIYQIVPGIIPENVLNNKLKGTQYEGLIDSDSNPILVLYSLKNKV